MNSRHRNRGFVLLLAVGMVSIVAVLVLLLTMRMHADVRRTRSAMATAQMTQLTLAGVQIARDSMNAQARLPEDPIVLPPAIGERARLWLEPLEMADDAVELRIGVRWDALQTHHNARLQRTDDGWRLVSLLPEADDTGPSR